MPDVEVVAEFPQGLRIERVTASPGAADDDGPPSADVWLVGDDAEVVVIDPAHDPDAILAAVGDRDLRLVVCTHGHADHIDAAVEVAAEREAQIALHPRDARLWHEEYGKDLRWDIDLADGGGIEVADAELVVLHTPGHTPGSVSLYATDLDVVLTGDTLVGVEVLGGADAELVLRSIRRKLLDLPPETRVLGGHGVDTTIGAVAEEYDAWLEAAATQGAAG
jgi:glyoxylase-like metal-dependent hydrolase (beta-lactamase superfamily II)